MFPFRSRSIFNRMFHLADLMAYDMERQFARQWRRPLDHFERQALTQRQRLRDPFEEFDQALVERSRPRDLFEELDQALVERTRYRDPFAELHNELAQTIETSFKDMETKMDMENQTPPKVGSDVYYKMIMRTDNNGHVKVKTMEKEPGAEWKIKMEEFKREGDQALENKESKTEKIENKAQEKVEKVAEPIKEKPKEINQSA